MTRRAGPRTVAYIVPASKLGGGNRVMMDLVVRLDRQRFTPLVIAPTEGPLVTWASELGIPVQIVPGADYVGWLATLRRAAHFLWIFQRHRVAIVHAMAETCYRGAAIAATAAGASRIVHLGFPPDVPHLRASLPVGPDALIGCYDGQAREIGALVQKFRPRCTAIGIPNGIDLRRFADGPIAEQSPLRAYRAGASHIVLIVGHLSEVKGHSIFLRAAAEILRTHPKCRFLVLGDETTDHGARQRYEALSDALGIAHAVTFLGWRADVPDVLRVADVVALPSLSEGLPLAAIEAMASGRPVVATPVGGVPEAVEHGQTGLLVPPGDHLALGAALDELLRDEPRRLQLGRQARRAAEERFDLDRVVKRVQALYDELL